MMTTRFWQSSESSRAISRTLVVFPTPGRPCHRSVHYQDSSPRTSRTMPHRAQKQAVQALDKITNSTEC